jgi:hypothetical protein
MNYGRAFTYVTEDPQWIQKVGIAALILIIPILGQIIVLGWALEVTRHIINGEPEVLPDWNNFGDFLGKGFQAFVIAFAYSLPVVLVSSCFQGLNSVLLNSNNDQAQAIGTAIGVVGICVSCISILYDIALGLVLPAALGNFAATGQLSSGFRFNEVFGLVRSAPGPYVIVFLLSIVTSLISLIGLVACVIGVLVTAAYAVTVNAHLWGQAYKAAKSMSGSLPPMAPAAPTM